MTYQVGETGTIVVGIEGTVQAVGDGTVTINGVTLPTSLAGGDGAPTARYISTEFPPPAGVVVECDGDCCDGSGCGSGAEAERRASRLAAAILREHDEHHDGPARFCAHPLCRETGVAA